MTEEIIPVTIAFGDVNGPGSMEATLRIMREADAALDIERIESGEKVYLSGNTAGITSEA